MQGRRTLTSIATLSVAFALATAAEEAPLAYLAPDADHTATVGLAGQDPADIGRYLMARGAANAQLSPDGSRIAFIYSASGTPQLWVSAPGEQPQQLTFGGNVRFFRWLPDGQHLLYGADTNGNELDSYLVIRADGGGEREVLPSKARAFRVFGGFRRNASTGAPSIVYASTERTGLHFDAYETQLATGDTRLIREGHFGQYVRSVSPDGKLAIIAESVGEDANNLYLLNLTDGTLQTLLQPDPRADSARGGFAWQPDSKGFYAATNVAHEFAALTHFAVDTHVRKTIAAPNADVQNINLCGARFLIWTENYDGDQQVRAMDLQTGKPVATPQLDPGVHQLSCGPASTVAAIRSSTWNTPGDVRLWQLANGSLSHAFHSNLAGLDAQRLVAPESVRLTARDGVTVQGLLYLPDANSRRGDEPPPVLFRVHGGPTAQTMQQFDPISQYHVDRGVAVFQTNVRGSTGFGRTFTTLDDKELRLNSVRDLVDMLAYLRRDGRVDADRAAVAGGSYGGYAVNAVLAAYPGHFKAGVSLFGVADWVTGLTVVSPSLRASDRLEYGDIEEPRWRAFYQEHSPIQQADNIDVPVLYSHGVQDPRVHIGETETMVRALRRNGVHAPYIRFEDEGHGWRKLSNRLFYYREEARFLEDVLTAD